MTRAERLEKQRDPKGWLEGQGVVDVRLFGSYARHEAGPDSDTAERRPCGLIPAMRPNVHEIVDRIARLEGLAAGRDRDAFRSDMALPPSPPPSEFF